ncbi:MAG: DUF4867 family protein [Clostridiales bacterium]|nr:DUF4867 family protein [Clostridiales bacterium]
MDQILMALRSANPNLLIEEVTDPSFRQYGQLLPHFQFPEMKRYIYEETPIPADVTCSPELMAMDEAIQITQYVYGETACQVGYFSDSPDHMNALEYHKCSELLVEFEPCVIIVGQIWQIEQDRLNAADLKVFYVPADTCLELYATTLHFAPCAATTAGVRQVVCQTATTNTPLHHPERRDLTGENKYLLQRNKWVIAHKDAAPMFDETVWMGIEGENLAVIPVAKREV